MTPVRFGLFFALALILPACGGSGDSGPSPREPDKPSPPPPAEPVEPAQNGNTGDQDAHEPDGAREAFSTVHAARSLELAGKYDLALEAYRSAFARDPESPQLVRALSRVYFKAGRFPESVAVLAGHLESHAHAETHLALIRLLERLGQRDEARRQEDALIADGPVPLNVARALASMAMSRREAVRAADILGRATAPADRPAAPFEEAGELLLENGHAQAAADWFEKALEKNPDGPARLGLARSLSRMRRRREAADQALSWARAHPGDVDGLLTAGAILEKARRFHDAADVYEAGLSTRPRAAGLWLVLARVQRRTDHMSEAVTSYEKAIAGGAGGAQARYEHATLLLWLDRFGDAERSFRELLPGLKGRSDHVLHVLALSLAQQGKQLDQAEAHARSAVEQRPGVGAYLAVLGFTLARKGDLEGAARVFQETENLDPDPLVETLRAQFLALAGKVDQACAAWRKAADLDPRLEEKSEARIRALKR